MPAEQLTPKQIVRELDKYVIGQEDAKKFVATLQTNDAGKNPILIRIETKAGHGAGKPTSKKVPRCFPAVESCTAAAPFERRRGILIPTKLKIRPCGSEFGEELNLTHTCF